MNAKSDNANFESTLFTSGDLSCMAIIARKLKYWKIRHKLKYMTQE
jgi:hypothetical protein